MLTVHLRVNDVATGRPTPVRLRVSGPDGTYFAPFGRPAEFARGRNEDVGGNLLVVRDRFCYIDGSCEIKLPNGVPLRVQATKGPEYEPLDEAVILGPGQVALRFAVRRWSDVRADGWHPGDTRAHFLTPHSAALEAAAEDLSVVNLLACVQSIPSLDGILYPGIPNITAFSGQRPALQTESALVAVNTLNFHPVLGSVGLLHSHRAVYPLTFGGDDTDDWSVCDWCDQCHRKNGLAVWVRPFESEIGCEALVALLLGKIDAIEFDAQPRKQPILPWWYRLLNAGFPVPLVGGSGKDSNAVPLGAPRTYARLVPGEPLTYTNWVSAVRAGRCFVTNGPLLTLDADGHGPGETTDLPEPATLRIRATADCVSPFEKLELVADGQVISSTLAAADGPRWAAAVAAEITARESAWVVARCVGGAGPFLDPGQPTFAHTAPVYLRVAGRPMPRREAARLPLRQAVERTRGWIELHGRFDEQKRKRHLYDLCATALARLGGAADGPVTSAAPTA
jgi:hypothetical protein